MIKWSRRKKWRFSLLPWHFGGTRRTYIGTSTCMFKCFFRFWCNRPLFNRAQIFFWSSCVFLCSIFVVLSLFFFLCVYACFFFFLASEAPSCFVLFCRLLSSSFFFLCSLACSFSLVSFLSLYFFFFSSC